MNKKLSLIDLTGVKILSAKISDKKEIIILTTETKEIFLTWSGDCCSKCYVVHVSGLYFLIGATISRVENTTWSVLSAPNEEDIFNCGYTTESMGTKLFTNKGSITIECRLEHNGYYGGTVNISEGAPLGQYSDFYTPDDMSEIVFSDLTEDL